MSHTDYAQHEEGGIAISLSGSFLAPLSWLLDIPPTRMLVLLTDKLYFRNNLLS